MDLTASTIPQLGLSSYMEKKNQRQANEAPSQNVTEELDDINARVRGRGADRLRRRIEATIESKAKKRRAREAPTSSAWKR